MPHPILAQSYARELLNVKPFPAFMGYSSRLLAESWDSSNLYWARLADEMGYSPVMLNRLVPELTRRMVEKIFATDFEDWPAILRAMRETGEEFRQGKIALYRRMAVLPGPSLFFRGSCRKPDRGLLSKDFMGRRNQKHHDKKILSISLAAPWLLLSLPGTTARSRRRPAYSSCGQPGAVECGGDRQQRATMYRASSSGLRDHRGWHSAKHCHIWRGNEPAAIGGHLAVG